MLNHLTYGIFIIIVVAQSFCLPAIVLARSSDLQVLMIVAVAQKPEGQGYLEVSRLLIKIGVASENGHCVILGFSHCRQHMRCSTPAPPASGIQSDGYLRPTASPVDPASSQVATSTPLPLQYGLIVRWLHPPHCLSSRDRIQSGGWLHRIASPVGTASNQVATSTPLSF